MRGFALDQLGDHQDLFQLVEIGGRPHANVQEKIRSLSNPGHRADRKALGEDAVAATGTNFFSHLHGVVAHDVLEHYLAAGSAAHNTLQPRLLEDPSHAARLVVDEQHLRGGPEHLQHLADDAVDRDHRHVGLQPVALALVKVENARLLAAPGPDHLRGHGLGDELLLESKQGLQAARLGRIFIEAHLLQAQALDLALEFAVLRPHPAQIHVVVPEVPAAAVHPVEDLLEGSDGIDGPDTNQAGGFRIGRALDLHGQSQHLDHQDTGQHDQVLVTAEDGFHNTSFKFPVSGFEFPLTEYSA